MHKKNNVVYLLSFAILFISYLLCRYAFYDIHKMKEIPTLLFILGMGSMTISFYFRGKMTPICIAFAYIAGFIVGVVFQRNGIDAGGGTTNNLWIIWTGTIVCLTLVGIFVDKFISRQKSK